MAGLTAPIAVSPNLLAAPATAASTAELARSKAKDAAQKFEGQFLSMMLQQMFAGVKTDGPFGGGFGEEMFRSVMTEAMGKQMARAGGIGLADTIQREILKMQGLT
jgi:Rod binding domain-containing protein